MREVIAETNYKKNGANLNSSVQMTVKSIVSVSSLRSKS